MSQSKLGRFTRDQFKRIITDKTHIKLLPDYAIPKGIDYILENYPYYDITLEQFHKIVSQPNSTLKKLNVRYSAYNINRSRDNVDHWVAESLKEFDYDYYSKMYGWTKCARITRAFQTFLKFARPLHTSKTINSNPWYKRCYERALKDTKSLFKGNKFKTLLIPDFLKQIPQNTAAGFPYQGKRKSDVWSEVHRKSIANYFNLIQGGKMENLPFTIALRGHLSPIDELKTRPIWLAPFEHIVMENILFRNVYNFVFEDKDMSNLILTGKDTLSRLRDYLAMDPPMHYFNLDFKSWDAWRARFVGIDLFNILKDVIDFKPGEENILYFVRKQFLNTRIMMPDGTVYESQAGTPSGSLLTALINSLFNFIITKTCIYVLNYEAFIEHIRILGDDLSFYAGVTDGKGKKLLDDLTLLYKELFGMTLSVEKCTVTPPEAPIEDKMFIGYRLVGSQLFKPEEDFFLSVLYPEHEVKNVVVSFSRVFSYFMLGGIYHNKFCSFFSQYLGHYKHLLMKEDRLLTEEVFKMGNLRVIKHVFQIEVDVFLESFDLKKFKQIDFMRLPYFLTLKIPLKSILNTD